MPKLSLDEIEELINEDEEEPRKKKKEKKEIKLKKEDLYNL